MGSRGVVGEQLGGENLVGCNNKKQTAKQTKKQINKSGGEKKGIITKDSSGTQGIVKTYFKKYFFFPTAKSKENVLIA